MNENKEYYLYRASRCAEEHREEVKIWMRYQKAESVWAVLCSVFCFLGSLFGLYSFSFFSGVLTALWIYEYFDSVNKIRTANKWLELRHKWLEEADRYYS